MSGPDRNVEYRGTGFYVGLVAILLFALALLVLAVQNTQEVDVDFLGFAFTVPLFAVAIGAAILAVVLDELIGLVWRRRRRTRLEERAELDRLRSGETRLAEEGRARRDEDVEPAGLEMERPAESPRVDVGENEMNRGPGDTPGDTP
jgi:uncharacterized integral membrane protein